MKYMDFLLLNPVFNFHTTLYSKNIVNFIIFFTVSFTTELYENYKARLAVPEIVSFVERSQNTLTEIFHSINK